ncbi:MAG: hypothetical protein JEY71_16820 [Sphaerochaeta sp.]|nr:hypothetical protein [Sphaerochaeta sp.]
MDTESKLIIEKLMLAFLALKALLRKRGIGFDESEKPQKAQQGYEKQSKTQIEQNIADQVEKIAILKEQEIQPPNPLDDKSPLVSQKALPTNTVLSAEESLVVFASLFRGRNMYARRWESGKSGKNGYSPACKNEGVYGVCDKRSTKCSDQPYL